MSSLELGRIEMREELVERSKVEGIEIRVLEK